MNVYVSILIRVGRTKSELRQFTFPTIFDTHLKKLTSAWVRLQHQRIIPVFCCTLPRSAIRRLLSEIATAAPTGRTPIPDRQAQCNKVASRHGFRAIPFLVDVALALIVFLGHSCPHWLHLIFAAFLDMAPRFLLGIDSAKQ